MRLTCFLNTFETPAGREWATAHAPELAGVAAARLADAGCPARSAAGGLVLNLALLPAPAAAGGQLSEVSTQLLLTAMEGLQAEADDAVLKARLGAVRALVRREGAAARALAAELGLKDALGAVAAARPGFRAEAAEVAASL